MKPVLQVENLHTYFHAEEGLLKAVAGVSFFLKKGETLGLVGESGCGKTVTALSLMRLVPPPGKIERGRIMLEEEDLLALSEKEMREVRGKEMAMIFQEPMTSLNPVFTIGDQIMEAVLVHEKVGKAAARRRAIELLEQVSISQPAERLKDYPHQFSGGMRQRVMIAMALGCNPQVLIADEPTTALDVTIQAQILELLSRLRKEREMALLLVTHDLGVVAQESHRVAVMYLGTLVETSSTADLFRNPLHPYTRALLRSVPRLGERKKRLETIKGNVPSLLRIPSGCSFHPRCPEAEDICREREPVLEEKRSGHWVSCHLVQDRRWEE